MEKRYFGAYINNIKKAGQYSGFFYINLISKIIRKFINRFNRFYQTRNREQALPVS